jgi:hypothetical protein
VDGVCRLLARAVGSTAVLLIVLEARAVCSDGGRLLSAVVSKLTGEKGV